MKANELRVGDLVDDYQFKKPVKVTIGVLEEMENGMNFYQPIQLTEEWLLRFGFYEVEESEVYDKDIDGERYISINIKPKKCFVGASVDWTSIKFPESVHQLQNLYHALTGQELKLNDK